MEKQPGTDLHFIYVKNFFERIKTRKDPVCSVENGRLVALDAHTANMALRTQSRLVWDDENKNFGNNPAANAMILHEYRKPWPIPKIWHICIHYINRITE